MYQFPAALLNEFPNGGKQNANESDDRWNRKKAKIKTSTHNKLFDIACKVAACCLD